MPEQQWWQNVDLSEMNDPVRAGEFVTTTGGKLFLGSKRLLCWGGNVGPWFVTSPQPLIRDAIYRFARAGGNAIRIHHTDSKNFCNYFNVKDTNADASLRTHTTDKLDANYMRQLSWVINCCSEFGIRVWLDLWDYRQFTGADLAAKPWLKPLFDRPINDDPRKKGEAGYYALVNDDVRKELISTFRQVLEYHNEYRGCKYYEDPTIAFIDLGNENRLCWGTKGFDPINDGVINSDYEQWWMAGWPAFVDRVKPPNIKAPGVGKRMIGMYLAEMERNAFKHMRDSIRDIWAPNRPLVTHAQWGDAPFNALASIASVGNGSAGHWYSRQNPSDPNRLLQNPDQRLWSSVETLIAGHALDGMWLAVSEWGAVQQVGNKREAISDCVESIHAMAAACIRQDVDVPLLFMYQQGLATKATDVGYEFGMNDQVMAAFAAVAPLVRNLSMREGLPVRLGRLSLEEIFGYRNDIATGGFVQPSAHTSAWLRELIVQGRRVRMQMPSCVELPWLGVR